jgi:hypothetical protein
MSSIRVYLVRPGASQREGPFSLEQINRDLAEGRYTDKDFWAWYEGLSDWVPLYDVPGVGQKSPKAQPSAQQSEPDASPSLPWQHEYFDVLAKIVEGGGFLDSILEKRPALAVRGRDYVGTHVACYALWLIAALSLRQLLPKVLADPEGTARLLSRMSSALHTCQTANRFTLLSEHSRAMENYRRQVHDLAPDPAGKARITSGLCFAATALGHDFASAVNDSKVRARFAKTAQSPEFAKFAVEGEYIYEILEEFHNALMTHALVKKLAEQHGYYE